MKLDSHTTTKTDISNSRDKAKSIKRIKALRYERYLHYRVPSCSGVEWGQASLSFEHESTLTCRWCPRGSCWFFSQLRLLLPLLCSSRAHPHNPWIGSSRSTLTLHVASISKPTHLHNIKHLSSIMHKENRRSNIKKRLQMQFTHSPQFENYKNDAQSRQLKKLDAAVLSDAWMNGNHTI